MVRSESWRRARRILCVHLDTLGDVMMTGPALRAVKESEPDRHVSLLTSPSGAEAGRLMASMIRREAFLQVRGFDPRLFLGGEEALMAYDLAEAGWSMMYLPTAIVHHHPSELRDSIARRRLLLRNALWVTWLRRPMGIVWRETWRALHMGWSDPILRPSVIEALRGIVWIAPRRRRLSSRVESQIRALETISLGHHAPDRMSSSRQSASP